MVEKRRKKIREVPADINAEHSALLAKANALKRPHFFN